MVYVKSILVGVAAVVVAAIASLFATAIYLWIAYRPPDTGSEGSIGWDPISVTRPAPWLLLIGILIFLAGFFWEFRRAIRR